MQPVHDETIGRVVLENLVAKAIPRDEIIRVQKKSEKADKDNV